MTSWKGREAGRILGEDNVCGALANCRIRDKIEAKLVEARRIEE